VKAIQIEEFGGPEVLRLTEVPDPEPDDGQVVVDVARAGINFADTHAIRNDYLAEQTLPLIPGGEVSGTAPDGRRVARTSRRAKPSWWRPPGEEPAASPSSSPSAPAPR
jgi:NADPH2:quinone reductase